jgi:hypothetical protein
MKMAGFEMIGTILDGVIASNTRGYFMHQPRHATAILVTLILEESNALDACCSMRQWLV